MQTSIGIGVGLGRSFPVPVVPLAGNPPPVRQPSQRWDALPDLNFLWWEQFRNQPIPITFLLLLRPRDQQPQQQDANFIQQTAPHYFPG